MDYLAYISFLRIAVLMRQSFPSPILAELVENRNNCKILFSEDIGFTLSQIVSNDVAKTFRQQKFIISIVFIVFLLFSIVLRQ